MTKEDIIAKVKTLSLPKNSYILFGSCPMAAADIREANDIDMLVSKEVYKNLEKSGWQKISKGANDTPLIRDVFEVHNTWAFSSYNPTLEDLLTRALEFEGIPFASIGDVRKWKSASSQPRHAVDVKLIDDYLKKQYAKN